MFVVVENTPGYLPEGMDDPAEFATLAEAQEYAAELAENCRDEAFQYDDATVTQESETLWRVSVGDPYVQSRVVEIIES